MLALLPTYIVAQNLHTVGEDFHFVSYLIGNGMKEEATTLINNRKADCDSMRFLKAYTYYNVMELDSAAKYYTAVGKNSPLRTESLFFGSVANLHLEQPNIAENLLNLVDDTSAMVRNLAMFERAGIKLLQRDFKGFEDCMKLVDTNDYRISSEVAEFTRIKKELQKRDKSPLLAATMSAIIPGAGKVYTGNLGEGIATFLTTGSLIAVTAENWYKSGFYDWKTILFGTLSACFYIGNIYGSAVTVRISRDALNKQRNVQILYNIHIPIRNSYRR